MTNACEEELKSKEKKAVTKAAVAKKILKKKIIPNKKINFDEEGKVNFSYRFLYLVP